MVNSWKYATIGILAVTLTAAASSVMTAYVMRPASESQASVPEPGARSEPGPVAIERHRRAVASALPPRVTHPVRATSAGEVARMSTSPSAAVAAAPAPVAAPTTPMPSVDPVGSALPAPSVPGDCATGADRAWRIAKPGGIGGLLGAALGAASGALADGGTGAGKGALIGAGVGAVAGGAYGAYKTQKECGTILGASSRFAG